VKRNTCLYRAGRRSKGLHMCRNRNVAAAVKKFDVIPEEVSIMMSSFHWSLCSGEESCNGIKQTPRH
jgi:hypothetical protein